MIAIWRAMMPRPTLVLLDDSPNSAETRRPTHEPDIGKLANPIRQGGHLESISYDARRNSFRRARREDAETVYNHQSRRWTALHAHPIRGVKSRIGWVSVRWHFYEELIATGRMTVCLRAGFFVVGFVAS
ncbi:hypothetical protein [Bradyrhizobium canariense]|uniref:hypothetical protein n=1 Tax=Bradyrhizobium canariense TaxID=255045 RepID=UPI0018EA2162|nr:hypothetical protein [Bradyrhizobium canariense]